MTEPDRTTDSTPASPDDTAALLRRWHAGDREALHELVQRDLPWIRARVRQRLGEGLRQHGDTDDFLHEAVLDILAWTPRFIANDREVFRRMVTRIVENTLRGQAEFYARMRRDRARIADSDCVLELDARQRTDTTPSQQAARHEEEAWLRLAMDLLDPDDRDVIVCREWRGESFGEIGQRLGVPENTARMRFSRAVGRLATQVEALRRGVV